MALMDPVASLVDEFNLGPLTVERQGAKVQNATFGFDEGPVATFSIDPVAYHNVTGRDLEQVPEADRNSEVVQFYARDSSWPIVQTPGFRVSDGGDQPDVITVETRKYRVVTVRNFSTQGRVWCAFGVLLDLQAVA